MEREAQIQDKLKDLIETVAKKYRFHGLEITHVERDYPIDARKADLVLFVRGEIPFMIIETKREGKESSKLFDPLDVSVVGQAMSYAAIYKRSHNAIIPFVATANPDRVAVFRTPESVEDYIDKEAILNRDYKRAFVGRRYSHLLKNQMEMYEKLGLNEEYINILLEKLAKDYIEKRVIKVEPTKALIGRFREFVDEVTKQCKPLMESKIKDKLLRSEVEKLGYKLDPDNLPLTTNNLTRMMTYVLMNKIIFYKILEGSYGLPKMASLDSSSTTKFTEQLDSFFRRAIDKTGDFEPIFKTGVYDRLPIPDDLEFMEYINDFISTLDSVDLVEIGPQIGYMYEELIPPEERHQLGQFYTPNWVCELITKWCIRGPDDVVMDPGVGSGGFLLRAYQKLKEEKIGEVPSSLVRREVHERILSQLYALDINPFPAHLSAMAISMKNVKVPSTELKVLVRDFFSIFPNQEVFTPYTLKTPAGEVRRKFIIPEFDAAIGNPPYTRWTEIPSETQRLIRKRLGKLMKEYKLTPQVSRGVEPGIYTHWIMHAADFLKEGGRLGMIISNTWLQTDYGIGFGNFLLDHFKVKAIIDIALKLFKGALITTCIVLAERESDEAKRLENEVAFIHIPGEVESGDAAELLEAVETGMSEKYTVTLVKQKELPRDRKWIDMFFKTVDISKHPLMTKLGELFEPSYGNVAYLFLTSIGKIRGVRNLGISEFHYLNPLQLKEHGLQEWAYPNAQLEKCLFYPAITVAKDTRFFTFTKDDWDNTIKNNSRCYMFICHEPERNLPKAVIDYIRWGETECRGKEKPRQKGAKGRLANETEAAKARARETRYFYGWHDVGKVIPVPFFAVREARYKTRFTLCKFPVSMFDRLIAFMPKEKISISEVQLKALLAYLNSSLTQFYIELGGRYVAKGPMGLDVGMAREMPILDMRKLDDKQLSLLTRLFDGLERKAREIGGASERKQIEKLKPKIYEIDHALAKILGIKDEDVKNVQRQVDLMVERRVGAAKKAS